MIQNQMFPAEPATLDRTAAEVETRTHLANFLNRQRYWARRKGLELEGSARERGDKVYVKELGFNNMEPMCVEHHKMFACGNGNELTGKMRALHSSSNLCYSYWSYWANRNLLDIPARALGLPTGASDGRFEHQFPITPSRPPANVDFTYRSGTARSLVLCEHKAVEPLSGYGHLGIRPVYMEHAHIWDGLANLRSLARQLCPDDRSYTLCHPAQLIKHTVGAHIATRGSKRFRLAVVFYDHGLEEFTRELRDLKPYWERDGLSLTWRSYQEAISHICSEHWDAHREWCSYMSERFL